MFIQGNGVVERVYRTIKRIAKEAENLSVWFLLGLLCRLNSQTLLLLNCFIKNTCCFICLSKAVTVRLIPLQIMIFAISLYCWAAYKSLKTFLFDSLRWLLCDGPKYSFQLEVIHASALLGRSRDTVLNARPFVTLTTVRANWSQCSSFRSVWSWLRPTVPSSPRSWVLPKRQVFPPSSAKYPSCRSPSLSTLRSQTLASQWIRSLTFPALNLGRTLPHQPSPLSTATGTRKDFGNPTPATIAVTIPKNRTLSDSVDFWMLW